MRFKKDFIFVLIIIAVIAVVVFTMRNIKNCNTLEKRELRLKETVGLDTASIKQELIINGYIISGYTTENNNRHGLAVFEPNANGNYNFERSVLLDSDEVVFFQVSIEQTWYDLFWADKPDLEYAEITYTIKGKMDNTMTIDAKDNKIIHVETPSKSHKVQCVFVDNLGTRYE